MNGLVNYASSNEDDDEQLAETISTTRGHDTANAIHPKVQTTHTHEHNALATSIEPPIAGPTLPPADAHTLEEIDTPMSETPPPSYSTDREHIRALTMPRFPNFDIPRSPSPPAANSEEAAELMMRTRKFERFLELKKQGQHFNDRLASSTALRNPELLQKLADFAGISPEEQYGNTLGSSLAIPEKWPDGFLESLVTGNKKKTKEEKDSRTKLDFVPASVRSKKG